VSHLGKLLLADRARGTVVPKEDEVARLGGGLAGAAASPMEYDV
jgi:hypothetical protein